jgi:hypothetical protein
MVRPMIENGANEFCRHRKVVWENGGICKHRNPKFKAPVLPIGEAILMQRTDGLNNDQ